ncbi:hypothetical protein BDY24DRAFT_395358 [Mrakia frigida]|uniref:uncharacterized protein n=1 Tax=Mrakia frigida TaxID=29902 RepID=UPI003FCC1029
MPLPFVPLTLNSEPKIRGEREWQGGGGKKNGPRHKVVFDLHLQHLALHHLPSLSTSTHQHRQQQQQEKRQRSLDSSIGSPSTEIPTLPEALLWQGSETRGALKFRLRLRSPPSICLLLDDSHHEIVIPLSNITSLQLLDAPNAVNGEEEGQNEQAKQGNKEEGFENMERRLRLGGMVLEMGVVKGVSFSSLSAR